jgi:hypothetical protein
MSEHKLTYQGKGASVIGRCTCGVAFLASYSLGSKRLAIRSEHDRHVSNVRYAETADLQSYREQMLDAGRGHLLRDED